MNQADDGQRQGDSVTQARPNQFSLLRQRRFAPFFWAMFLGAFNDNLYKNALAIMVAFQGARLMGLAADDLVNPPEIGVLEREIKRVPKGRAIVVPLSDQTVGHGTHTMAKVWKQYLEELLKSSAR